MSGLQGGTRLTVSLGTFTGSAGSYTGRVASIGSVGYSVSDIGPGMLLFSGRAIYEIQQVNVVVPGATVDIDVTYLTGTGSTEQAPSGARGQITDATPNLGLPLFTQWGSSYLSPEQVAKLLTHAMLVIDAAGTGGGAAAPVGFELLNQTGGTVSVAGLPANPSYILLHRDGLVQFSTQYSVSAGQIEFPTPLDAESIAGYWIP